MAVPPISRVAARIPSAAFERVRVPAVDFLIDVIQFVPIHKYCHIRGKWNPRSSERSGAFCVAIWRELGSNRWMLVAVTSCYWSYSDQSICVNFGVNELLTINYLKIL